MDVEIGGTTRRVTVRPSGTGWRASVDGRELEVEIERVGDRWSLLVREGGTGDRPVRSFRSYEVVAESKGAGQLVVHVARHALPVSIPHLRRYTDRRRAAQGGEDSGPRPVTAPMPGRVVKVLVTEGQDVAARQPVVIVEAMKMENELRSSRAGRISRVLVSDGTPVEAGAVLLVVE